MKNKIKNDAVIVKSRRTTRISFPMATTGQSHWAVFVAPNGCSHHSAGLQLPSAPVIRIKE